MVVFKNYKKNFLKKNSTHLQESQDQEEIIVKQQKRDGKILQSDILEL
jgi:hypothetical protein